MSKYAELIQYLSEIGILVQPSVQNLLLKIYREITEDLKDT